MKFTDEDIEFEWNTWGNTKPWHCPKCDSLLAPDAYTECDGTDPDLPEEEQKPHPKILASPSISFEEFYNIQKRWDDKREEQE